MSLPIIQKGIIPVTANTGPVITPAGASATFTEENTIAGVTIPPGGMLVVYAGITGDTSEATRSNVTWNGLPLTSSEDHYSPDAQLYADIFFIRSLAGGTGDLVANNVDSALDTNFMVANIIVGPTAYRQTWFTQSGVASSPANSAIPMDDTDQEIGVVWAKGAVADPGDFSANMTPGQGLRLNGTFGVGYISTGASGNRLVGPQLFTKTLTPAASWLFQIAEFLSP